MASDALLYYIFQSCMESMSHSSGFHTGRKIAIQNNGRRSSKDENSDALSSIARRVHYSVLESMDATPPQEVSLFIRKVV